MDYNTFVNGKKFLCSLLPKKFLSVPYLLENQNLYNSCMFSFLFLSFFIFLHEKCISFELLLFLKWWCFKGVCIEDTNQHEWMPKLNSHQMMSLALNLKALQFRKLQTCSPVEFCFTQVQLVFVHTDLENLQALFRSYFFQAVFSRFFFSLCQMYQKKTQHHNNISFSITKLLGRWQEQIKMAVLRRGRRGCELLHSNNHIQKTMRQNATIFNEHKPSARYLLCGEDLNFLLKSSRTTHHMIFYTGTLLECFPECHAVQWLPVPELWLIWECDWNWYHCDSIHFQ